MTIEPNILLLHCHDLGDHLGAYGWTSAATPHLDRLAQDGVLFESYFAAAPTCSPSRGSMLTGLMPHRNGLMALASGGHWEVRSDVPTLPALLQDAGYATASFGTWHISAEIRNRGVEVGNQDADVDHATASAVAYLRQPPENRPFFLMVGFNKPHLPWQTPGPAPATVKVPDYLEDTPEIREELSRFYGEVHQMDAAVGAVLAVLEEEGLADVTLVIFTSDHGIGMPLAKGTLYDPGVKIPLIMRGPGVANPGRRFSDLSSNVDLLPTLLDAVGEAARIAGQMDGRSLWPWVAREEDVAREHILLEQTWHDFYEPMRAIRTERYKLIRNLLPEAGPESHGLQIAADILQTQAVDVMREQLRAWPRPSVELYDLAQDPTERRNLAGHPEVEGIEAELRDKLDAWLVETDDPILEGVVPAPPGYWEHFLAKPVGPGALPAAVGEEGWLTIRWPSGATQHRCQDS